MTRAALALAAALLLGACDGPGPIDVSRPPPPGDWGTPGPARYGAEPAAERVEAGATAEIRGTEEARP